MIKPLLTAYLNHLHAIHASGKATDERSYYPTLAELFNSVGKELKPRVIAVPDVKDQGVGHPDFLLQVETTGDTRAAVEVKGTTPDVDAIVKTEQVGRYLSHHDPTLVTNLREFALVRMGRGHQPEVIMRYALATDEAAFWSASVTTLANTHAERFGDFLESVLTWDAEIKRPRDLAEALARYARETLRRLEQQPAAAVEPLRKALSEALGLQFTGANGEHFFRSSLVQTLFYGLFSAWVACNRQGNCDDFRWKDAGDYLGLPLVRELFEKTAIPIQLETMDIRKPLEWAEAALRRTAWEPFAAAFNTGDAINYFYEPFLEAFDPQLRRDLGVWYTPPEVVRYMVARVDTVLREELDVAAGLADENVYVLDPCCGTGAYLLETLRHIAATLKDNGGDALLAADLRKAATSRVFGFEIMPAPFVVAQLQIGTLLADLGAPLKQQERAGVYLTNALTGWEKGAGQLPLAGFPELKHEAELSAEVKQDKPILVILGNPPYNGFAGTAMAEERSLSNAYRTTKRAPAPQGQGLNDLYVRFFRMAERRIVEKTGKGVVCFISNYSWLDGLSFTGMRERYLEAFDKIWIDNLNGDKYKTGKLTPDGKPDPSVFSTESNPEGIQVGTAIATLVRKEPHTETPEVNFRHFWGKTKRQQLIESLAPPALTPGPSPHRRGEEMHNTEKPDTVKSAAAFEVPLPGGEGFRVRATPPYTPITPAVEIGLPFIPATVGVDYLAWPRLPDLFPVSFPGVKTSRDDVVVDIDKARLLQRMEQYFDPSINHEQMRQIAPGAMADSARFDAKATRDFLRKRGFLARNVVRYCYRPFDVRWLYWEPETKLLDEKRADYFPQVFEGNVWIEGRQRHSMEQFDRGFITTVLADNLGNGLSNYFPLYLKSDTKQASLFAKTPNLSAKASAYLERFGGGNDNLPSAESLFYHTIAMMHAPAYRAENAGALRQDWPRIPLPASAELLTASAQLGRQIAALLDTERPVDGVTAGKIRDELKTIGAITRVGGGQLNPDTDLTVTAGWGYAGREGVTMPGQGKTKTRDLLPDETAIGDSAKTLDIYLNDVAYWRNVPARVWEYTIGGYQVIKKWLSYREYKVLGRSLTSDEAREVMNIARRIAAILLLEDALDDNYAAVKAHTWSA